jgi:hypothetical protein
MAETHPNKSDYDSRYVQRGSVGMWTIGAIVAIVLVLGAIALFSSGPSSDTSSLEALPPVTDTQDEMAPAVPEGAETAPAVPEEAPVEGAPLAPAEETPAPTGG